MSRAKPVAPRRLRTALAAVLSAAGSACTGQGGPSEAGTAPGAEPTPAERIALWRQQSAGEPLPAALTFDRELNWQQTREFLERYDLRPFAIHLRLAESSFAPWVRPEDASLALVGRARDQARDLVLHTLCGGRGVEARLDRELAPGRDSASQAALERAMLTHLELSRRSLAELREGAPMVYGVKVVGAVPTIERLQAEPMVSRVEPWMRMPIRGTERTVGPDPVMPRQESPSEPIPWIAELSPTEVRARLRQRIREPPAECAAWRERQEEIRREGMRTRGVSPPDTTAPPPRRRG